jgi:hypothetical protein
VSFQVKIIYLPRWWTLRVFSCQIRALWFWPEKARTVHHLESSMILTWEDMYCQSFGELCDFDLRRHVLSNRAPQMMDSTCLFRSKSYISPDDGHYVSSHVKFIELPKWWTVRVFSLESSMILTWEDMYCQSFGELCDFDLRRHVLSIIWEAMRFWPEKTRTVPDDGQYVCSQIKMIELPRWWTLRVFSCQIHRAPQMMDSTCLLMSNS